MSLIWHFFSMHRYKHILFQYSIKFYVIFFSKMIFWDYFLWDFIIMHYYNISHYFGIKYMFKHVWWNKLTIFISEFYLHLHLHMPFHPMYLLYNLSFPFVVFIHSLFSGYYVNLPCSILPLTSVFYQECFGAT